MYIIEFIIKKFRELKQKRNGKIPEIAVGANEEAQNNCSEHVYLPIDSTKQTLACKNCGHVINAKQKR